MATWVLRSSSLLSKAARRPAMLIQTRHILAATRGEKRDLELKVTNYQKEDKGTVTLSGDIFDVPIRKDITHQVVRWQLAKRRKGQACTKNIREVRGTGKKPFAQKGTGRARHGTLRGPQFRGGATMHGPRPRSYKYKLNKLVRRLGLKIALSARVAERKLVLFDAIDPPTHKTRDFVRLLSGSGIEFKKLLFVEEGLDKTINRNFRLASGNLQNVDIIPAQGLNVYSILCHDTLVMTTKAVREVEDRLHTPINR